MATTPDDGAPVMKSTLKILVPLVALVGLVFGVTLLLQYTPTEEKDGGKGPKGGGGERPLTFFTSTRAWDGRPVWAVYPDAPSPTAPDHFFPGFFEKNTKTRTAFWFENRNASPVSVQLKGVTCSSCSGGSLAPVPPEALRNLLQLTAVSGLPLGLTSPLPLGLAAGAWADTVGRLQWQSHKFATTDWTFTVPAAPKDPWSPSQLGILVLEFDTAGKNHLGATFASQVQGSADQFAEDTFNINFEVVNPFELAPLTINVGELRDNSQPRIDEFFVFSATREPGTGDGQLPPPNCRVSMPGGAGEPGKLVAVEPPVLIPEAEYASLAERMSGPSKTVRVRAAYRVPVRITPQAGDDRLDIGLLEREVWVTVPVSNAAERAVKIQGKVTGGVGLRDAKEFALGTFKGKDGATKEEVLAADRPETELEVVPGQCRPEFLKVELKRLPSGPDRGLYAVKVTVPPDRQFGAINNGVVVLQIKGPKPQRVRIPVTGSGGF
jgi:hypothetical protein